MLSVASINWPKSTPRFTAWWLSKSKLPRRPRKRLRRPRRWPAKGAAGAGAGAGTPAPRWAVIGWRQVTWPRAHLWLAAVPVRVPGAEPAAGVRRHAGAGRHHRVQGLQQERGGRLRGGQYQQLLVNYTNFGQMCQLLLLYFRTPMS